MSGEKARRATGKGGKFSAHERAQVRDVPMYALKYSSISVAAITPRKTKPYPCMPLATAEIYLYEQANGGSVRTNSARRCMLVVVGRHDNTHFNPRKNTIGRSGFFIQNVRNHSHSLSFICVFCNQIGINSGFFDIKILKYNRVGIDWNFFENDIEILRIYNRIFIFHIKF